MCRGVQRSTNGCQRTGRLHSGAMAKFTMLTLIAATTTWSAGAGEGLLAFPGRLLPNWPNYQHFIIYTVHYSATETLRLPDLNPHGASSGSVRSAPGLPPATSRGLVAAPPCCGCGVCCCCGVGPHAVAQPRPCNALAMCTVVMTEYDWVV